MRDDSFGDIPIFNLDAQPYPGYRFRYGCSDENVYKNDAGLEVIEVFGKAYLVESGGKHRLKTDTVAVLRDEDAPIYGMLQWRNAWRSHTTMQLVFQFKLATAWVVLSAIHGIAACAGILGGWVYIPFTVLILPALEIVVALRLWRHIRLCFGVCSVLLRVWSNMRAHGKSRAYYHELFTNLSRANARDKAYAAKVMASII